MLISLPLSDCSVDGKYVPQGKLGCALLGSHSSKDVGKPMQPRYSSSSIASYLPPLLFPPLPSPALPFLLPYRPLHLSPSPPLLSFPLPPSSLLILLSLPLSPSLPSLPLFSLPLLLPPLPSCMQYKLLVYISRNKHVTTANVDASFSYTVSQPCWPLTSYPWPGYEVVYQL